MLITYSESPSFNSGWWLSVNTWKKEVYFRLLPRDAFQRASSEMVRYEKYYTVIGLDPDDEVRLFQQLDKVRIKVVEQMSGTLDGTLQALSISSGSSFIGLEWNTYMPTGYSGVQELVEKLRELAEKCRNKREADNTGATSSKG